MRKPVAFQFGPVSRKQQRLMSWWLPASPWNDWDGVIADGSIRSGKTIAMAAGFVLWSSTCFSGVNFIVSGRTMGALKRNVVQPMQSILHAFGVEFNYNRSENYIEFGGNTYFLFGANTEASQDTLQGITAAGWFADEAALHPRSFIEQAIARCSVDGSKYWLNCNPEHPGHFVKTDIIDQAESKRFSRLHFTMEDNLTLSETIKNRYRRMYSGVWYKRFILGLWVAAEGAVWASFDRERHVVDRVPALARLYLAADYGTTNPTVYLLCGEGLDRNHYVLDEWRWDSRKERRQKSDADYSAAMAEWLGVPRETGPHTLVNPFLSGAIVDPSAASFSVQLQQDMAGGKFANPFQIMPAKNDVLNGVRLVDAMFSLEKLFIHRRCTGLIGEIEGYSWDEKAREKGKDEPAKIADHGPDALRYYTYTVVGDVGRLVGLR